MLFCVLCSINRPTQSADVHFKCATHAATTTLVGHIHQAYNKIQSYIYEWEEYANPDIPAACR